jgi:hypothetical protein
MPITGSGVRKMTFRCRRWLLAAIIITCPCIAYAGSGSEVDSLGSILSRVSADPLEVRTAFKEALGDPQLLNRVLQKLLSGSEGHEILKGLQVEFKTFNADNGNATGLGLSYEYAKEIKRQELSNRVASQSGLAFSLNAQGNVAFERAINPRDFLDTHLDFSFFRSAGGAVAADSSVWSRLNKVEDVLTQETNEKAMFKSPAWDEFARTVQSHMSTQTYFDLGAAVSYEANQAFTTTQFVYRGQVGFDLKAWNDQSALAQWNFFDWPAAAVRFFSGVDPKFTPYGSSIPTLLASIDFVDPSENPVREALHEMDNYPRFRFESAYKSLVAQQGEHDVFWLMDFRYYQEIGASDAVKAADQDNFVYFVTAVTLGESLFASYSDGQLPFDAARDKVYELGFKLAF